MENQIKVVSECVEILEKRGLDIESVLVTKDRVQFKFLYKGRSIGVWHMFYEYGGIFFPASIVCQAVLYTYEEMKNKVERQ